ncbi:MAG: alpha/beta fold hydrolase [Bacteroidota bacterium]
MNQKMRKWAKRLGLGLIGLYLLICAGLYFFQEMMLFHPDTIAADYKFQYEEDFEEIWLDAELDGRVNGLLFKRPNPRGVVLYLHGNGGNIQKAARVRHNIIPAGFDVFLIDYRTFGKSTGPRTQEGIYADAEAAWQYLAQRYGPDKINIFGTSMGSGIATHTAKNHPPRKLILEAPYTSIKDVAAGRFPWLPIGMLIRFPFPSIDNLPGLDSDILVLHGTEDKVIPYAHGKAMAEAHPRAKLVTLEGKGHRLSPIDTRQPILEFLR